MSSLTNDALETLYAEVKVRFAAIANRVLTSRRGRGASAYLEASDLINAAFAPTDSTRDNYHTSYIARWVSQYDPLVAAAAGRKIAATTEVALRCDCDDYLIHGSCSCDTRKAAPTEEGLKIWLYYNFKNFCGDQCLRRQNAPTLNFKSKPDPRVTPLEVSAVQWSDEVEHPPVPVEEESEDYLEFCDAMEADVLKRMYLDGHTRQQIADDYGVHPNTISAIKKSAIDQIRRKILVPGPIS